MFRELAERKQSRLELDYYTDRLMAWGMKDEEFKVSLFRFVDVLPSLPTAASVVRHVHEYFGPLRGKLPEILKKGLDVDSDGVLAKVVAPSIRKQVRFMAERFIVGETPEKALRALRKLRRNGTAFTVDLLGEATVSEAESQVYKERYLHLIKALSASVPAWAESAPLVPNHICEATAVNVSVKLSALYSQARAVCTDHSVQVLADRLGEIISEAKRTGAFVYVDMEDCALTSITLRTFMKVMSSNELKTYDRCGIVLQAYLRRTEDDMHELATWAKRRGAPVAVRLVKGAYWDTETILAKQHGWPIPVWQHKRSSDASYERLSLYLLENHNHLIPAFASHNIRSLCHAIVAADLLGVPRERFEIQTLYGMGDAIKELFVRRGYLVREYAPVGELIPGMGYLVRRLLENTSNEGFLRQSLHENRSPRDLLRRPEIVPGDTGADHLSWDPQREFVNSALRDMTIDSEREALGDAIAALRRDLQSAPYRVGPIVGGLELEPAQTIPSTAPEDPSIVIAHVGLASKDDAGRAVDSLSRFFPTWRRTAPSDRTALLRRVADIFERDRADLTALIVMESAKPWIEADADVAEAIDFLRYYALEADSLFRTRTAASLQGERNLYFYEPRGVTAVISPWNFPLAIPCGMFAAALVTGNCALLKPAEQTSMIASRLFGAFLEAGLPPEAAAFLPGIGEDVGPVIAQHPAVSTIVFTGSKEVGMILLRQGAASSPHAEHVKRVVAEMGGKNAIIVDDDADYDEAIKAIVTSAFGYQGQKCSACSRLIIVGDIYDRFVERLAEAVRSIVVGPPSQPTTFMGPLIDESAHRRVQQAIDIGKRECTLLVEGMLPEKLPARAAYVRPTVFVDVPGDHMLFTNEIFGPVLAVQRASTFAAAIDAANRSEYGLTGAVFSRSPANIERAFREFRVGNLYLNRGSTGALVYRQPFGGAKMSGVGSKAGGPDYLLQFVIPRNVTENTMRRGFAPVEAAERSGI